MKDFNSDLHVSLCEFESASSKPNIIGETNVPLRELANQEEYDINLEICDAFDKDRVKWVIISKMVFVYSPFTYHQDQYSLCDQKHQHLVASIQKYTKLIDNLSEPFNLTVSAFDSKANYLDVSLDDNSNNVQHRTAGKIEKTIKAGFSKSL